jgi:2,4-dienoyl-CoA reductase-like NADH-dependent reductase (Old Yellow Enzyme family)
MRFPLEVVAAVRAAWPDHKPLLVRMPAADLLEGGLTTAETTVVAARLAAAGVDMIDLASGVLTHDAPPGDEPLRNARYGRQGEEPNRARPLLGSHAGQELRRAFGCLHGEVVAAQVDEQDVEAVPVAVDSFPRREITYREHGDRLLRLAQR